MLTRANFIEILTKTAAKEQTSKDHALKDVKDNKSDNKGTLTKLFDEAGKVESQNTKTMDKLLPGKTKKETGNPLLKAAFAHALSKGSEKTAGEIGVIFMGFNRELEKISAHR